MNSIVLDMESRLSLITDTKYGVSRTCRNHGKARSPLSPHSPSFPHFPASPFSLSANTFSMLTEALRSVSSLRWV